MYNKIYECPLKCLYFMIKKRVYISFIIHHYSFFVTFPLKGGCTLICLVFSIFRHRSLSIGSIRIIFQSSLSCRTVFAQFFLGLPRLRLPSTTKFAKCLMHPSFRCTCLYHLNLLYLTADLISVMHNFSNREAEPRLFEMEFYP